MIDDWGKELILTNFVSTTNFIKRLEDTVKNGIATVPNYTEVYIGEV